MMPIFDELFTEYVKTPYEYESDLNYYEGLLEEREPIAEATDSSV